VALGQDRMTPKHRPPTRAAWNRSSRKDRLPRDWPSRRAEVFRTKGRICLLAYAGVCTLEATEVDHIEPGDNHEPDNLQPVCSECHAVKSSAEGYHARARKGRARMRKTEKHPGFT